VDSIEQEMLDIVLEAAREKRDWRAAVRWLEIHDPGRYKSASARGGRPAGAVSAPDRVKLRAVGSKPAS